MSDDYSDYARLAAEAAAQVAEAMEDLEGLQNQIDQGKVDDSHVDQGQAQNCQADGQPDYNQMDQNQSDAQAALDEMKLQISNQNLKSHGHDHDKPAHDENIYNAGGGMIENGNDSDVENSGWGVVNQDPIQGEISGTGEEMRPLPDDRSFEMDEAEKAAMEKHEKEVHQQFYELRNINLSPQTAESFYEVVQEEAHIVSNHFHEKVELNEANTQLTQEDYQHAQEHPQLKLKILPGDSQDTIDKKLDDFKQAFEKEHQYIVTQIEERVARFDYHIGHIDEIENDIPKKKEQYEEALAKVGTPNEFHALVASAQFSSLATDAYSSANTLPAIIQAYDEFVSEERALRAEYEMKVAPYLKKKAV